MSAPKKPQTFDQHLGAVVGGLAGPHGGRPFLIGLLGWSKGTVDRRVAGSAPFLVRELEVVSRALNTTSEAIAEQALKNYADDGTVEGGMAKLIAEDAPVSIAPASLSEHRTKKSVADMSDEEVEALRNAAKRNIELEQDESY